MKNHGQPICNPYVGRIWTSHRFWSHLCTSFMGFDPIESNGFFFLFSYLSLFLFLYLSYLLFLLTSSTSLFHQFLEISDPLSFFNSSFVVNQTQLLAFSSFVLLFLCRNRIQRERKGRRK